MAANNNERRVVLKDMFYPTQRSRITCIQLPDENGAHFELKSHYISQLPKFMGHDDEDAYGFLEEFEDVCNLMKIQNLTDDSILLRFVPFVLRDQVRRWLQSLPPNSITSWEQFSAIFLKRFYPIAKTNEMRKVINSCYQMPEESFANFFSRFNELLVRCPHHGIPLRRQCQIVYDGIPTSVKGLLESMVQGDFANLEDTVAWNFLGELAAKTLSWEKSSPRSETRQEKGIHSINATTALEMKYGSLLKRVEVIEGKGKEPLKCLGCNMVGHIVNECPMLANPSTDVQEIYTRNNQRQEVYGNSYNPSWRNHPNFSWRNSHFQDNQHGESSNFQGNQPIRNTMELAKKNDHSAAIEDMGKKIDSLIKGMEAFAMNNAKYQPIVHANAQSISKIEAQLSQISARLCEREKGTIPSQAITNPRVNQVETTSGEK